MNKEQTHRAPSKARSRAPQRPIPKAKKARVAPWQTRKHDPTLGRYFRDLSEHEVLSSEQELEKAKRLSELEIDRWRYLLGDAEIALEIVAALKRITDPDNDGKVVEELRNKARRCCSSQKRSGTSGKRALSRYERCVDDLATRLHESDVKRELIDTAHQRLTAMAANAPRGEAKKLRTLLKRCNTAAAEVQGAKHAFIRANLRLVVAIARRYDRGQMPLIDLIQEGNLGLIKAVERFDYRRGFRFSTYASWWIRHAIGRALADKGQAVRVPVHALDAQQRLSRAAETIGLRMGRPATDEELSKETGIEKRRLERVRKHRVVPVFSLDRQISNTDDRRYIDMLADERTMNPFDNTMLRAWNKDMDEILDVLTPMERTILRWRFGLDNEGEGMTLKEIGDHYSLSRERIRQLQEQALRKIREHLDLDAA